MKRKNLAMNKKYIFFKKIIKPLVIFTKTVYNNIRKQNELARAEANSALDLYVGGGL